VHLASAAHLYYSSTSMLSASPQRHGLSLGEKRNWLARKARGSVRACHVYTPGAPR